MKKFSLFAICVMMCLLAGCEQNVPAISEPLVTTIDATQISLRTAIVGGSVTDDGGSEVVERGICYSTSANPSISDKKIACGNGLGEFICNLTNLEKATRYYVRAYATNCVGTSYGEEVKFTTLDKIQVEAVDLGLSVKWANMNIGAERPEEYGDYFAWGEIEPKEEYNWSTYKWCNGSKNSLTKYNYDGSYGTIDYKSVLEVEDDAATANWGSSWRMPTMAEQEELCTHCTWTWTTQNGVNGYNVMSNSNGNSIFLPAAGCRRDSSTYEAGNGGYYWSSSLDDLYFSPPYRYLLYFDSDYVSGGHYYRDRGQSVRPVHQ